MKSLFENRFPFVKQSDELLTADQIEIKRKYEKSYNGIDGVVCKPCEAEKTKVHKLRKVYADESGIRGGSEQRGISDGDTENVLSKGQETVD